MILKIIILFSRKYHLTDNTFHFSVLQCQRVLIVDCKVSQFKVQTHSMFTSLPEMWKSKHRWRQFFSVTPYGWKWDVNSVFEKEDRRPCSRSLQQSWCFFQDYRSYEWFHLRLYTLVQYAPLYSCELCLQYFLLAEATQVSLQVSFPIAQSTLQWGCHACSQHLWLQFLMGNRKKSTSLNLFHSHYSDIFSSKKLLQITCKFY